MKLTVANAPISYGAFELTVGIDPNVPDGEMVLDEVQRAGYAGIDLGPVGYLGDGPVLAERLAARNLGLAGAYLEFPFTDPDALEALYPELDAMLDTFDAVRDVVPGPPPRPTIADAGSDARRAAPGRSSIDHSVGLDDDSGARSRWRGEERRTLSRPGLRAHLPPRDGHLRRGALGDREGHRTSRTWVCASRRDTSSSAGAILSPTC